MPLIEFTDNYEDLSTDVGFQFKFYCERCGNGYMSEFSPYSMGRMTGLLRAAGGLLGGTAARAADTAYEVQRAVGGPAHDNALKQAVTEVRPHFHQCSRCGEWVCDECWNATRGLCENCAADVQEELAAAQQEQMLEQVRERVRETNYAEQINVADTAMTACPHCGAKVSGGKFCNECGKPLVMETACPKCGAKNDADAKFCSECGERLA